MPTIEASHRDLCRLIGKVMSLDELGEAIEYAKGEIDSSEGDSLKIDIKDTNRPDLWSAEGIAREVKLRLFGGGCPHYHTSDSGVVVTVDKKNKKVRPYTVCAVVKGIDIFSDVLSQMIQLQEKVCCTFGRNRKEVALGVYDFDRLKPPITFTTVKPDKIKFVPLDFQNEMTPKEILEKHPKGIEYRHLLEGMKEYPIFKDSRGEVLSMPPIINSNYSGKVTEDTKNIFIECSGFNPKFLMPALNILVAAMADRGGQIQTVRVVYPDNEVVTPDLSAKTSWVDVDYVNKLSGLRLTGEEICELLKKAGYEAKLNGKRIDLFYPAYRQDIMHQRDIVEDVIISYGYNRVEPVMPSTKTTGGIDSLEVFSDEVSNKMTGMGFQEIMSYTLTSKDRLFGKMNVEEEAIVEIENPSSENWCVLRNWMMPSLMEFFSNNQHVSYPQKIFEIGDVMIIDANQETKMRDVRKLAAAISDSKAGYQDIASVLDRLMSSLGKEYRLKRASHPSFIPGRAAKVIFEGEEIGIVGEVTPSVLENWKLEMPTAAFEIEI